MENQTKKQKPFYKRVWFIILAVLVILYIIGTINGGGEQERPVTVPKTEEQKPSAAKKPKPAPVTTWHEIARWQGKSIKNTETFHIPSREWRISWSTKPGEYGDMNFQIFIYKSDGSLVTVAANVIGEDKDSSFMRGSGDYYLTINTGQPYLVIVEAKY